MKLAARDGEAYVKTLGPRQRAALVFGEDRGAVREWAERIGTAVAPLADPFRVAILEAGALGDDPRRLGDELGALSLMGGRRLIWLREAGDRQKSAVETALTLVHEAGGEPPFLLVEAADLTYRSSLRLLFEEHRGAVALHCAGGQIADSEALIHAHLAEVKRNIAPEAFALLLDRLGPDRALARRALEGLAFYMASAPAGAMVQAEDVLAAVPDAGEAELDGIINTVLDGKRPALDQALSRAFLGGASAVGLLRIAQRNFQRVHWVMRQAEDGQSVEGAVARLRPPLPRAAQALFAARCRHWKPRTAERALQRLLEAEIRCKTTGLPEETVCADAFHAIAGLKGR